VHSLGGQSKRHSDSSEKTLGYIGDNDTDSENEVSDRIISVDETKNKEGDTQEKSDSRDDLNESLNLNSKRSLGRLGSLGEVSNETNDSVVTSSEDDTSTSSGSALGTEESNILRFEDVRGSLLRDTEELFRFTSQRRVVNLHLIGVEQDSVSWDVVTTINLDKISDNKTLSGDLLPLAITAALSSSGDEVVEFIHKRGSLGGLLVGEATSNECDCGEHNTKIQVSFIIKVGVLFLLDTVSDETEEGSEPKK